MNTTVVSSPDTRGRSASNQLRGNPLSQGATPLSLSSITQNIGISSSNPTDDKQTEKQVPPKPKRDYFVQVPHMIFDSDLPHMTRWGFAEFLRHFGRAGSFDGSIRKLCKILGMARATVAKIIADWVKAGWVLVGNRAKEYEDGDVMSILILSDCLWVDNHECYTKTDEVEEDESETGPESSQGGSKVSQGGKEMNHNGANVDQRGSKRDRNGSFLGQTGTPPTLKNDPNIREIDSKIESNMDGNMGREDSALPTQQQRTTEPLPALPPSLDTEKKELSWETITPQTPHCAEAIMTIATHYLGAAKVTQADADAFVAKTQSTATLTGPHEVRRQLIRNITFLLYSNHASNWCANNESRKQQLMFSKVVAWYDDYTRKSKAASWEPPVEKVPGWYHADETPSQQPQEGGMEGEENYFAGMSEAEAASLTLRIQAEYPGMKITWGNLPCGRFTVGLWQGQNERGKDDWLDFYQSWEWAQRGDDPRFGYVLEAYEQCRLAEVA